RQLADWGANVIKIELPVGDDGMGGQRHGFDFQNLHRNKRSASLNLKTEEGKALFLRMVEKADVVLENWRSDVKTRLGVDYESLRAVNPRIILGSISGFGQTGPWATRPGVDQIAQGVGGLMSITGLPGDGPVRAGIPITDLCAGLFLAQGVLLALFERERSGQGQWVHTSLLQAMISMLDFQAARWTMSGDVPPQAGNMHPTGIPTAVFKTADGHINIQAGGDRLYHRLCKAIGAEQLITDPRFAKPEDRSRNRDEIMVELEPYLARRGSDEWIEILNEAGVPCGPILSIDKVFANEQVRHLHMAQGIHSKTLGDIEVVAHPVTGDPDGRVRQSIPAPDCGEHNEEVYAELGLGPRELADLKARNVI
ncbi:MAG: CoA transferase, partial [Gammaproteobacteria bacterium]|nr:CoA transferase [Gammaproteobacteria bacterium]